MVTQKLFQTRTVSFLEFPPDYFYSSPHTICVYWQYWGINITGGNRTMVTAATIVSMAAAKKAQQNVFALYHSYNCTILLWFIWILDFHFKIVLVLRCYLIPIWCNNGKRKMWPWRWLHHFDFSNDDGCTCWWRWLHYFGRVIFDTHTADPLQTNMLIGCMIVVKYVWYVYKISGAYAHLDCITSTVVDVGNRHSMQFTHSYNVYLIYFLPNSKLIYGWSDTTNLNFRWVQNIANFKEW